MLRLKQEALHKRDGFAVVGHRRRKLLDSSLTFSLSLTVTRLRQHAEAAVQRGLLTSLRVAQVVYKGQRRGAK